MLKKLTLKDIPQVVKIHREELRGFLSQMGKDFLKKFYEVSLGIPEMFTLVEKQDEQIQGFATGAVRLKSLTIRILFKDVLGFVRIFMNILFTHPILLLGSVKTLTYPGFSQDVPELLTIAVQKNFQNRGTGKKLFQAIKNKFQKRSVKYFQVSMYAKLPAGKFYEKMGCRLIKNFAFRGQNMSYYHCQVN
ncbi:GNAT family N-acetyltransferase [Candidatus Gottesmanbacteria bacterium]|nr:GNAT family N-acetyltransferase [Candidatus Gottesmanbacteria bacterium]